MENKKEGILKKFWIKLAYFFAFTSIVGIVMSVYKRELYLIFKSIILLLFWICTILEDKLSDKNKVATKISWGLLIVLTSLSVLETFDA